MSDAMIEVGDLNQFRFRISAQPYWLIPGYGAFPQHRDVAIYIGGCEVSPDHQVYIPTYAHSLRRCAKRLAETLRFDWHAHLFCDYDLVRLHVILPCGEYPAHGSEAEWEDAAHMHHFMSLHEPNTDLFSSFLLPVVDGLRLTYQLRNPRTGAYDTPDVVRTTRNKVLPYDLVRTMEEAAAIIERLDCISVESGSPDKGNDGMIEVGDLNQFGFRIGPPRVEDLQFREVALYIAGRDVTPDPQAWAPAYAKGLRSHAERLKNTINFERYARLFDDYNLSELHRMLLHREHPSIGTQEEWENAREFHRFMHLNMPETDGLASFLLPSVRGLHLTYQLRDEKLQAYERLEVVDGTQRTVRPYDLIRTMEEAAAILERGVAEHLSEE